jgi:hypothetical protein
MACRGKGKMKEVHKINIGDWQARIWDAGEDMGEFRYAAELLHYRNLDPQDCSPCWVGKAYPTLEEATAALDDIIQERAIS